MRSESSRRLGEAVAFSAFYVAFYLCRYGVLPMAPLMAHEWGVGYGELGASISLMYAGYLASLMAAVREELNASASAACPSSCWLTGWLRA